MRKGFKGLVGIACAALLLVSAAAVFAAGEQEAGAKVHSLKIGVVTPEGHPHTIGAKHLAELLEERSDGRLDVKVHHSGEIGSNPEMLDQVAQGVLAMTVNIPGGMAEYHPITGLLELPYVFTSLEHRNAVCSGDIGAEIAEVYLEETGMRILGYFGGAQRNIITREVPIRSIEDLRGLKMRTWEWDIMINWWKSLGAIPAVVAFPEVYTALQTGVVDGAENEFTTFDVSKWGEVCSYVALTQHNFTVRPLVASEKLLNQLPQNLKELVIETGKDASAFAVETETSMDRENKEMVKEKFDLEYTTPDKTPFIERSLPIVRDFAEENGISDIAERIIELGQ